MTVSALGIAGATDIAWYCLRSQPKHEHVAAANLRRLYGFSVLNPRIRFKKVTRRGMVWVTEPVFPSYLFARFDRSQSMNAVMHAPGVAGVVHFGAYWPTIPQGMMEELYALVGDEEVRMIEQTLNVGDEVEIVDGGFCGFTGVVTRLMPARDRVAVLMDFFGRQTLVEVGRNAVTNRELRFPNQLIAGAA